MRKPQTFTSRERLIQAIVDEIYSSGKTFKKIAEECNLGTATVQRLASGSTRWPRATTLFPLLDALNIHIEIHRNKR